MLSRSTALESKDSKVEHAGAQLYLDVGGISMWVERGSKWHLPQHLKITSKGKQAAKWVRSYCECDCIIYTLQFDDQGHPGKDKKARQVNCRPLYF